jgi:hypothetical protein
MTEYGQKVLNTYLDKRIADIMVEQKEGTTKALNDELSYLIN